MKKSDVKYPCRGCDYFEACGDTTRTEPCYGRRNSTEIEEICKDSELKECFFYFLSDEIFEQLTTDDVAPVKKYNYIVQKYFGGNHDEKALIDEVFMAVSGFRLSTILQCAYEKYLRSLEG